MKKAQAVNIAVILYIVSVVIGLAVLALDYDYMMRLAPAAASYTAIAISIAIVGLLLWKLSQGRNWARIVLLVFFILGSYTAYTTIIHSMERSVLLGALQVLQQLCIIASLALVFFPPGAEHFRKADAPAPDATAG
jgi:uncharacterized membrane protein